MATIIIRIRLHRLVAIRLFRNERFCQTKDYGGYCFR